MNNCVSFILLSGGIGSRMLNSVPKQYLLLAGRPIIVHTLERIDQISQIEEFIIVCADEYRETLEGYVKDYSLRNNYTFVPSGITRQESVKNGLIAASNKNVLIHEAARPFVKTGVFQQLINSPYENVTLGDSINYTVLLSKENKISGLLNRSELVNIQLPQKFNRELLLACHLKSVEDGLLFTDDTSMMHYYNNEVPIQVEKGSPLNLKITDPLDMVLGEEIYRQLFMQMER
jgi:2-C-methyl-D-erythritol 4-phosphate cytidylyltransferase